MKKLLYLVFLASVTGLLSCEKKSKWEKAGDSAENAVEKIGETADKSADAAKEETEKAGKKIKKLLN
jgi:hypothetical protein